MRTNFRKLCATLRLHQQDTKPVQEQDPIQKSIQIADKATVEKHHKDAIKLFPNQEEWISRILPNDKELPKTARAKDIWEMIQRARNPVADGSTLSKEASKTKETSKIKEPSKIKGEGWLLRHLFVAFIPTSGEATEALVTLHRAGLISRTILSDYMPRGVNSIPVETQLLSDD
ncbi:hypothetical protein VFPPC_14548 [Pochonia chlamydosporia 170]|uniref:Uncharacterized protein n=1 Tax=Pochonia chlamydosporia 170 TaxID=1380566 RepID=A0A179FCI6_METCM|nr:hypothetical protein VFPPC_14548 [Pochonia chlamydosporia 170]OAQ63285.1 hypothetical protein VFPPC_14548 [Pochonia chlamydosporia 170]